MKKIFSIVFAVALTTSLWATQTVVPAGSGTPENQIKAAVDAASAGDTIVLETATYVEWNSFKLDKEITLMAAPNTQPVVKVHYWNLNADFEAIGVKFCNVTTSAWYLFQTVTGGDLSIAFKGCTFDDCGEKYIYYIANTQSIASLTINNCVFKNATNSSNAVIYGDGTISTFEMRNSTVMNCTGSYPIRVKNASSIVVDHCTFYNNGERVMLLGDNTAPTTCSVSNCVVSNPATVTGYCFSTYGGTVDNTVYYNTANGPRSSSPVVVTNKVNADPLFVDPANGNFNFAFTSPLFLAATDGKHIGDPRWGVEVSSGETVPGALSLNAAVLNGAKISKTSAAISWSENDTKSTASWVINATKAGDYEVILTETTSSGHNYKVSVLDKDGNTVSVSEGSDKWKSGDLNLGTLAIAKAGYYLVRLENLTSYSASSISAIMFNYAGGAVVDVPATLPNADAVITGTNIAKTDNGITWNNNREGEVDYATWNINADEIGNYEVVINVSELNINGHNCAVSLYDGATLKASVSEGSQSEKTGAISLGNIAIAQAGEYAVRLTNAVKHSNITVASVTLNYKGGAVVELPDTLRPADAMLSEKAFVDNDSILFAPRGSEGYTKDGWAKWNVNVETKAKYFFAANVKSTNGYRFAIEVLDANEQSVYAYSTDSLWDGGQDALDLGSKILEAGAYTVKMQNIYNYSKGRLMYVAVTKEDLPVELTISEEDTDNAQLTANIDKTVNVNLVRKLVPGMFNTICLPFGVSSSTLAASEFAGAQIYQLDSTYLQGDEVVLCFKANSDFYQGVPYLIQPVDTITNPSFEGVVIKKDKGSTSTSKGGYACFRGILVKKQLEAGNENLLYLGKENKLYFPNTGDESSMNGLRAYFEIKQEPGAPIRRASIKMGTDVVTTLDLVDGQAVPNNKFMINGQIVIRVNGVDYMLNGARR